MPSPYPPPVSALTALRPPAPVAGAPLPPPVAAPVSGPSFAERLQQAQDAQALQFSGHARTRLQSRGLELTPERMQRLTQGVEQAAAKGAKSSLVLLDNVAMVVSVRNRTVITAMDATQLKENVFTNIDSAVIA